MSEEKPSDKGKTNWLLLALEDWTTWADRWDIIEGHYWFYVDWHGGQGSYFYERLSRIRSYYKPSRYHSGYGDLRPAGQAVYDELVTRHAHELF